MPSLDEVKERFGDPNWYLGKPFGVAVRALLVRRLLGNVEGVTLLDIGCGDGSLSLQFAAPTNQLTLIDLSGAMLERARRNVSRGLEKTVDFRQMDFRFFNAPDAFDVVLCIGVLAHVDSMANAVKKVASYLKPGGRAVFQITDGDAFVARFHSAVDVLRRWMGRPTYQPNPMNLETFLGLCRDVNLQVAGQRRYSLILPGMGKLPNNWLFRYQLASLDRPFLSRFGMDVVLLARKPV